MKTEERRRIAENKLEDAILYLLDNYNFQTPKHINQKEFSQTFHISNTIIHVLTKLGYLKSPKRGYIVLDKSFTDIDVSNLRDKINEYSNANNTKNKKKKSTNKTKDTSKTKKVKQPKPVSVFNYISSINNSKWRNVSEYEFDMIDKLGHAELPFQKDFRSAAVKILLVLESHFRFKQFKKELNKEENELLIGIQLCLKSY